MAYLKNVNIAASDSPSIDAFGRWRVSQVSSQLDLKQLHDSLPLFYDIETIGTGATAHTQAEARTQLTTAAASDVAIMQTKQRANYQTGKSQQIFMTFDTFDIQTNVTKRVGYFTHLTSTTPFDTTKDGLWLESSGAEVSINISQSGTLTESTGQSSWNLDALDGTGASGVTWDWDENTILLIDFEWLGLGRVRWGVVHEGIVIYFHESNNDQATATGVYISSPNQPIRAEIRQTGASSGTLNFVCATVGSEGSLEPLGKVLSANLGVSTINANSTANVYALLGIRLQSGQADTLVDIVDFSVLTTTNDDQLIQIFLNPTVAGTFTYNNVTNSSCQIALGDTGAGASGTTVTGGTLLYSEVVSSNSNHTIEIVNALRLGMNIDFTVDEIVLTTRPFTSNADVTGTISWRELS